MADKNENRGISTSEASTSSGISRGKTFDNPMTVKQSITNTDEFIKAGEKWLSEKGILPTDLSFPSLLSFYVSTCHESYSKSLDIYFTTRYDD